jgi:catechol 2,3-dioxygenase-like lactoylglutathione lyase family enzyme
LTFYTDALGATVVVPPTDVAGAIAGVVMDGPRGTRFRLGLVGFPDGSGIELFEFVGHARPAWLTDGLTVGRLPHLGLYVTDVDESLRAVEQRGGKRLWTEPMTLGPLRVVYVQDPDGNVLELLDATLPVVAEVLAGGRS